VTPLGLLYALLSLQRGGGPTSWETASTLLGWLAGEGDVIAATVPGSYLERRLWQSVARDRLFLHPVRQPTDRDWPGLTPWRPHDPPITLGAADRDLASPPLPWPAVTVPAPAPARVRTLDTLYGSSHRPGLIVIEDATTARAIFAGAGAVLRQSPVILICLASCPASDRWTRWEECAALLAGTSHEWFDGLLLPCATSDRRREAVSTCANEVICALPRALAERRLARGLPAPATLEELSVAAIAWNDWAGHVPPDAARRSELALAFDDSLPAYGLHGAESDGAGHWWRWSGPSAHARFILPLPAAGRWFLRLEVFDWGVAADAGTLRVFVQGTAVRCADYGPDGARFGPIDIARQDAASVLTVDLVTPPPRRASGDDPRRVGINLSRCVLERAA
jgi:hypothetical protein